MRKENFDEVAAAYDQVKKTAAALMDDYEQVCGDIDAAAAELRALPLAPVPFEDMKEAILDFVDASGERYAESVRDTVSKFANGKMAFDAVSHNSGKVRYEDIGKVIGFDVLDGSISGEEAGLCRAQLLNPTTIFDNRVLYYFCGALVREGLRKVMEKMRPEDFGYDRIPPEKIGTPRRERRAAIAALQERLDKLRSRQADLAGKLAKLGFPVPRIAKSKP
jgi:hypothetical protein